MLAITSETEQSLHCVSPEKQQYQMQRKAQFDLNSAQILSDLTAACEDTKASLQPITYPPKAEVTPEDASPTIPSLQGTTTSDQTAANIYEWFDEFNAHPEKEYFKFMDTGSPYFLQNSLSNSSHDSTENVCLLAGGAGAGGSSGEYRSVIDDLTIENKRLRKELRRYKKQSNRQLEKDKLFEIRIHALSLAKRRELEDALRSFTSSLNPSYEDRDSSQDKSRNRRWSEKTNKRPTKICSSTNTHCSQPQDSSLISMRASTQPTTVNLDVPSVEKQNFVDSTRGGDHYRKAFPLQSLPEIVSKSGLSHMTKKQKKKLVVQRLEQLFTGGKGITMGESSHALNQQKISTSALGDHSEQTLAGAREATMGPKDAGTVLQPAETVYDIEMSNLSDLSDDSKSASYSQRPTQPLDLDPDRAQVPSDNVEYLRHLGLSTPKLASDESTENNPNERGRWVYLNVLINMAQLHMINVTADFVRSAVSDVSQNLQLSKDGQMILWKGGNQMTNLESDEGSCISQDTESSNILAQSIVETQETGKGFAYHHESTPTTAENNTPSDFQYKPLVYRRSPSENSSQRSDSLLSRGTADQSISSLNPLRQSQGGGERMLSIERKQYDDGSMIFYSGVNFYIDLSGDRDAGMILLSDHSSDEDNAHQESYCFEPPASKIRRTKLGSRHTHHRFEEVPVSPNQEDNMELEMNQIFDKSVCDGFCLSEFPTESPQNPVPLQKFETGGNDGTQPSDHFGIHVLTRRSKAHDYTSSRNLPYPVPGLIRRVRMHTSKCMENHDRLNDGLSQAVDENTSQSLSSFQSNSLSRHLPVQTEIINSETFPLPPSNSHLSSNKKSLFHSIGGLKK